MPQHPAYATAPAAAIRQAILDNHKPETKFGDVGKFVRKVYELSEMPHPPLRVPLGVDATRGVHMQLDLVKKDLEVSEEWAGIMEED